MTAFKAYLTHMGLNRHYPRKVIFELEGCGGHGELYLSTVQGYKQLQLLVGNLRNWDETGTFIQQELDYLQLVIEVSITIMSKDTSLEFTVWMKDT